MEYSKEEYENLLNISINRAYESLKHFLKLLDLDETIFSNLFDADIKIDYDDIEVDEEEAALCHLGDMNEDPSIYIGLEYSNELLDALKDGISRQVVINSFSQTIVHELLHVNRAILLKEKYNSDTIKCLNKYSSNNNVNFIINYDKDDENIKLYDYLLDQSISNRTYDLFDNYVPLKVKDNFDSTYEVVAYSKKTNSYSFFNKIKLPYTISTMPLMTSVGLALNTKSLGFHPNSIIYLNKDNFKDTIYDPADYYSNINKDGTSIQNQVAFEEALVETISRIIIYLRKENEINLDKLQNKFNECGIEDIRLMYEILRRSKTDLLKWFMVSCREEYYDNKMSNLFEEKYNTILELFNKLSNETYDNKNYSTRDIEDTEKIIDEKITRK